MIWAHKILPLLLSPLAIIMYFLLASLLLRRYWPIVCGLFLLIFSSLPITANYIWSSLESSHPPAEIDRIGDSDAIVILGGYLDMLEINKKIIPAWGSPDRFFAGIDLMLAGKAKILVLTKDAKPWSATEAAVYEAKRRAIQMGVPAERILITDRVSNTEQEAFAVKKLAVEHDINSIILVTSSFHMPRAIALFAGQGFKVRTFATNFKSTDNSYAILNFLPSVETLLRTTQGMREYLGRWYYKTIRANATLY